MSWNWGVFLKSWLFGFLGFLIGVVSTVIYLALDVDLSKLDGTLIATIVLAIATVTLVIVSHKYAKSTEEILKEQRKSRQIAFIERRLEKLYLPLKDVLENPHTPYGKSERQIGWQKTEKIIPFQYLAYDDSERKIMDFIEYVLKLKEEGDLLFENIRNHDIIDVIKKDIDRCKNELNELINR